MAGVDVNVSGPLYDGTADRAAGEFVEDTTHELAVMGHDMVQSRLRSVLKDDTGHYRSRVITDRVSADGDWVVTDQGVIYGPWLEGTGSRNKTTRFKGYSTFRRTRQELAAKADSVADKNLPRYLERMGGDA